MSQFVISNISEDVVGRSFHLRECKKFLAKVFYGCADVIKRVINNQKPVMDIRSCAHINGCILVVVSFYVKTQVVINSLSIYCGEYASVTLIQQCQDCLVNIIVNQNDAFMGAPYDVADKNVCIEYLTVEKNALAWRQRCFKEEVNFT